MTDCFDRRIRLLKLRFFTIFIMAFVAGLAGCVNDRTVDPQPSSEQKYPNQEELQEVSINEEVKPINEIQGDFYEISGWVDDSTILYIVNQNGGSSVYFYDLFAGESKLFYESESPIAKAEISPKKEQVLIHSVPSNYEAELKVFTLEGSLLYSTRIESFELAFEWNQDNENKILVSAFNKDWSFSNFIFNSAEKSMSEIKLSQPFVIWPDEEELFYLDWDMNSPNLSAPLIKEGIISGEKQQILSLVHYVDSTKDYSLIIQTNEKDPERAVYTIMNHNLEPLSKFEELQLATFSGWLVPHYDMNDNRKSLLHFRPKTSGDADLYGGSFILAEHSFESGKETELFSDLENEPLSCSPEGLLCLYGYQFEKMIDLRDREIINLINQ